MSRNRWPVASWPTNSVNDPDRNVVLSPAPNRCIVLLWMPRAIAPRPSKTTFATKSGRAPTAHGVSPRSARLLLDGEPLASYSTPSLRAPTSVRTCTLSPLAIA